MRFDLGITEAARIY
ncbi:Protein of unknown function [Bacillus mycoides]|uniref:Uncharacterized protein n=1 Tax=Bacillus mycoides TaxID=1405 RepID=A0A1G4EWN1_BACMY|nr:Protein of unknown function [Bacillus mycoides]